MSWKIDTQYLDTLISEAIYVIRETLSQCQRPACLFSGGKDSIVLADLIRKACFPDKIRIPFIHIDTGHNFEETITFRDQLVQDLGMPLIVGSVPEAIQRGEIFDETGVGSTRNYLQTHVLLRTLSEHHIDAAFGGGRRDEEKSRAKERIFSHRDAFGQWNPKNQRPELWHLFNTRKAPGESFRVFPLSNWTELDIWAYIYHFDVPLPSLYYAHQRTVFEREGVLLSVSDFNPMNAHEETFTEQVRCRTIGDITCTGLWRSNANTNEEILREIIASEVTERGGRADDKRSDTALEDRKVEGYF